MSGVEGGGIVQGRQLKKKVRHPNGGFMLEFQSNIVIITIQLK